MTDVFASPLLKLKTEEEVIASADELAESSGLQEYRDVLRKGALFSVFSPTESFLETLTPDERQAIDKFKNNKWKQPFLLYFIAILSAASATVQGMDESAVGGASLFYTSYFHIDGTTSRDANIQGIVNSIPYLAASVIGCWLAIPSSTYFGRRFTVFWGSILAAGSGLWQAFSPSWQMLLVGRLIMGISIGAKSATVPVYTAECVPANIRGALVMMWQMFTAFGVMMGFVMGVAFLNVNHGWRYMLGSVFPLPVVVAALIYFGPESPRWYIDRKNYKKAFLTFSKLRNHDIIAASDFFYTVKTVELENAQRKNLSTISLIADFVRVPRVRFGALASWILMFGQQFCGVNVLTFYISTVLTGAGFSAHSALAGSCGFGALAVTGAITAFGIIDTKGRRWLLLTTYPIMCAFLLWVGFSFYAPDSKEKLGLVLSGIYVYVYFYGIGSGPVPFTYSAEAFPLYLRSMGMAFATATTWMFSWILGFTLPNMIRSIQTVGVFCFYAGWCAVLFVLILLFVPETKNYTLEELDLIFSIPIRSHASFQIKQSIIFIKKLFGNKSLEYGDIFDIILTEKQSLKSFDSSNENANYTKDIEKDPVSFVNSQ